jgi:hypothetical protein
MGLRERRMALEETLAGAPKEKKLPHTPMRVENALGVLRAGGHRVGIEGRVEKFGELSGSDPRQEALHYLLRTLGLNFAKNYPEVWHEFNSRYPPTKTVIKDTPEGKTAYPGAPPEQMALAEEALRGPLIPEKKTRPIAKIPLLSKTHKRAKAKKQEPSRRDPYMMPIPPFDTVWKNLTIDEHAKIYKALANNKLTPEDLQVIKRKLEENPENIYEILKLL